MKRILVLLVAACCLFASCEKESDGGLDGTTWAAVNQYFTIKLRDNKASSYNKGNLIDTQPYKVKGNQIFFDDYLIFYVGGNTSAFDKVGTFNDSKTELTILKYTMKESGAVPFPIDQGYNPAIFKRN